MSKYYQPIPRGLAGIPVDQVNFSANSEGTIHNGVNYKWAIYKGGTFVCSEDQQSQNFTPLYLSQSSSTTLDELKIGPNAPLGIDYEFHERISHNTDNSLIL